MTATDVDLDILLDRLLSRAAERDRPPLVNALGDVVNPLAPAGRVSVAPNELIQSAWGNLVYDQSTNQFVSAADRDSQWPAPPDGALCYTTAENTLWLRRSGTWQVLVGRPPTWSAGAAGVNYFTDATGEVFVSKTGVNAGAWRKARDVLYARAYRNAAFTASGTVVYDTIGQDSYGLWSTGTGKFTAPIAGDYLLVGALGVTSTAASQFVIPSLLKNAATWVQGPVIFAAAAGNGLLSAASDVIGCAAGDLLSVSSSGTSLAGTPGPSKTYATVQYVGTG